MLRLSGGGVSAEDQHMGVSSAKLAAALAALALALAWSRVALADALQSQANQRNLLPGGRAALMGGAFTAVADDATAGYYNPAGLAFTSDERLEVSGSAFRTAKLTYEHTINGEPFEESSSSIYPSFVGGTAQIGRLSLGYSFLTLDARNVYQRNDYDGLATQPGALQSYSRTYQETSRYAWTGGSAALTLTPRLSLGVSGFYYERTIEYSTHEFVALNGGGFRTVDDTMRTLNTGLAYVAGLVYRGSRVSFGLALRRPRALSDRSLVSIDEVSHDPSVADATPTVTRTRVSRPALDELNPTTYAVGLAWHPSPWLLVSFDALLHEGVATPYAEDGGHDLHETMNYSAGLALQLWSVSLMGGAFTNKSLFRAPDPARLNQPLHVDYTGVTGGMGWDIGGFSGQVGLVRQTGKGEAQLLSDRSDVQDVRAVSTTYLISGKVPL